MSLNDRLERWNENIEGTRKDLLLWAHGYANSIGTTWWSRNYKNVAFFAVFFKLAGVCYYYKWSNAMGVVVFIIIVAALDALWKPIKRLWTLLCLYLEARRLLRRK